MIGWAILYAFLTFVTLITLLIGGASYIMGLVNKDVGWTKFGLRVLLVTVLAFTVSCVLLWPHIKEVAGHGLKSFKNIIASILK